MKEPESNFSFVCPDHAPKPNKKLTEADLESFIGKFVKKGFKTKDKTVNIEHMWVRVKEAKNGKLVGTLSNDPIICRHLKNGDVVTVERSEIEDVLSY